MFTPIEVGDAVKTARRQAEEGRSGEIRGHRPKHSACPRQAWLARFLQRLVMNLSRLGLKNMPIEDRIEKIARLVLVALLFATIGWIV